MPVTAMFIPSDCTVADAAQIAQANGLGIYTDGQRTALLPRRLPGWFKLGVNAANDRRIDPRDAYEIHEQSAYLETYGAIKP